MAFWNKSLAQKHHVIEVITYDGPSDVLVWKHPGEDFNTNTQLVVGLAQEAVFVKDGQVLEHFMSGRYTLSNKNYPFLQRLVGLGSKGVSFFSCSVYYVNKVISMGLDWSTKSPISIIDPVYRVPIDICCNGSFSLKVENSQKLMEKLVGHSAGFTHQQIQQLFTNVMVSQVRGVITSTILERQLSPIGIDAYLPEMSALATEKLRPIFEPHGMSLVHFSITAVTALDMDIIKEQARDLQKFAAVRALNMGIIKEQVRDLQKDHTPMAEISNNIYTPYRGNSPYIFISYSHRESKVVSEIIKQLQMKQYRIWYDEGIDPGTEWDENIAAHIDACGYFIALLSKAYLESSNCKDELNYARDKEKPRLLVYLEDVQLPSGMKMRLSRLQAIHKYKYGSLGQFINKLSETTGLEVCRDLYASSGAVDIDEPINKEKKRAETEI